jgi:hypothetical protein
VQDDEQVHDEIDVAHPVLVIEDIDDRDYADMVDEVDDFDIDIDDIEQIDDELDEIVVIQLQVLHNVEVEVDDTVLVDELEHELHEYE